jgi:hypothetical protein
VASAAEKLASSAVWEEFCEELRVAAAVIERKLSPRDPLDRAEGYRYLGRLLRLALEKFVEHADPAAPSFYRLSHETAKIGCDNPDSYYRNAAISGRYEYRIRGNRGTARYLGFGTYYGHYGSSGPSGCSGYLEAGDMENAPDGSFEIVVSCREHAGNWLRMERDSSMLIVRETLLDRRRERPAELEIERLGVDGPPAVLSPERLVEGLAEAARFVRGTASLFADWAEGFARHPNALRPLDPAVAGAAHGDPNIFFHMGYWQIGPDEALLVEAKPPPCEYWNFQLNNYWMESLDYRYHRIHYNSHTTRYRPDGSFRLVVARSDPGVPNWVETAGHSRGTMGLRWVKASRHPQPSTRVVKLRELARE